MAIINPVRLEEDAESILWLRYDDAAQTWGRQREWKPGSTVANEQTLRGRADTAMVQLRAYDALATPTQAQTAAAVKVLARVVIVLVRLVLGRLDGDG